MHPPLFRPHPQCSDYVDLLVRCHDENPFGKYFGACNEAKSAMDKCFRAEKEEKRKENMRRGQLIEERFQRMMAEKEAAKKS